MAPAWVEEARTTEEGYAEEERVRPMNCTCKLGGKICGVCRGRKEFYERVKLLEVTVWELEARVRRLEAPDSPSKDP